MILLVQCPQCHNTMKVAPRGADLAGKRKRCVYCGTSFLIREQILKKL